MGCEKRFSVSLLYLSAFSISHSEMCKNVSCPIVNYRLHFWLDQPILKQKFYQVGIMVFIGNGSLYDCVGGLGLENRRLKDI
jgi:hypothetical protein